MIENAWIAQEIELMDKLSRQCPIHEMMECVMRRHGKSQWCKRVDSGECKFDIPVTHKKISLRA